MEASADPKSVKVNVTTGTGMEIEWKDGHQQRLQLSVSARCLPLRPV
jgi:hypothetical protein